MPLGSPSAYTESMHRFVVLFALALLMTPFVVPHAPLPAVPQTETASQAIEQESSLEEQTTLPDQKVVPPTPAPAVKKAEPAPLPQNTPEPKPAPSESIDLAAILEQKIWAFTNNERTRRDLGALKTNALLAQTARAHSADMLARNFFEHENPDGCSSSCRATNAGYSWRMIGENIYMLEGFEFSLEETAAMIVSGWMESPGHRANILREGYTETGVGVVVQGRAIYATTLYATPR